MNLKKNFNLPIVFLLTSVFFASCLIGILHHAMWRDELQAWCVARDTGSLAALFHQLRYEGHPCLWYLLLYGLAQWTPNPLAMQWLQILIASAGIFIFLQYSPFNRLYKILFIFGYFPLYEYGIKSRPYALGILFAFLICSLWKNRHKHYIPISILLFLLCQTSPMGWMLAMALGLTLIVETKPSAIKYTALMIFILGLTAAILQILPPADKGFNLGWSCNFDLIKTFRVLSIISNTYFQNYNFFNFATPAHTFFGLHDFINLFLSLSIFIFFTISFSKTKEILFLYLFGNAVILASSYTMYFGLPWHHGHLFILLMTCLWLEGYYSPSITKPNLLERLKQLFLLLILLCQLWAGIKAYAWDTSYHLSAAKETSEFIEAHGLKNMLIAGDPDYALTSVAGYLNKKIYYPKSQRFGSYVIWKKNEFDLAGPGKTISSVDKLIKEQKIDVLLILNYELPKDDQPLYVQRIKDFTSSILPDERYYLYIIHTGSLR